MEVVKYDIETAVITALEAKYADIKVVDGKSKAVAMAGLAEYRGLRTKIDAKHKELKHDALVYGRAVDDEKNRLKGLLAPGEQHIKDARQVYDDKIAAKKAEKERIEQERIDSIQARIDTLRPPVDLAQLTLKEISDAIDIAEATAIDESYMEFEGTANDVLTETTSALYVAYTARDKVEKEAAERKAEIEKLEKIRKDNEAAQAKIDKEKADFEAEKKAENEKRDRAEFERTAKEKADAQAKREAELEAQQKEKEKAETEKEAKRVEALKPDVEKLMDFADTLINFEIPIVKSADAKEITTLIRERLDKLASDITFSVESL